MVAHFRMLTDTFYTVEQRCSRVCSNAQRYQRFHCQHTQCMDVDEKCFSLLGTIYLSNVYCELANYMNVAQNFNCLAHYSL